MFVGFTGVRRGRAVKPFDQFDKDKATIWLLFIAAFAALFLTETSVGFVQDESVYFYAAERYTQWLWLLLHSPALALRDDAIVAAFDYNHEHPALMKLSFGISHWLFTEQLGWLQTGSGVSPSGFCHRRLHSAASLSIGSTAVR